MEGQYGGGALPCLCDEGTRLRDVLDVNIWDQSTQGKETTREWVDGSGNSQQKFNWLETTSCIDTKSMTTTINNTHLFQLPPEHHRSECQPGCDILWWPRTNWSD